MTIRERNDPIRRGEGSFAWMSRQAEGSKTRLCLDRMMRWVEEFPSDSHADLLSRLKSKSACQFDGAYFELFIHRLLKKSLCVEPVVPSLIIGASRPDFEVASKTGWTSVEATVFEDVEAESSVDGDGMDILRETTPKVRSPGFALWLERFQRGSNEPSKSRIAQKIDDILKSVSHAELLALSARSGQKHDVRALPEFTITDEPSGWSWTVRPMPLINSEVRPKSIVANSGEARVVCVKTAERLRDAIKVKLDQHAAKQVPLVIAACSNHWPGSPEVDDVAEALLGTEYWEVERQGPGVEGPFHKPDGLWTNPRSDHARPAAVIVTSMCKPWIDSRTVMLWENPKAPRIDWLAGWPFWRCHWKATPGPSTVSEGRLLSIGDLD